MNLEGLKQPPFNTSLMGVVKGAMDYIGIKTSDARAFGGSGHAFLINVHKQLCPSGPYCWDYERFYPLVRNLGLEMTDLGFFQKESAPAERAALEQRVKAELDAGRPCAVQNMDNQLIHGYDEAGFLLCQPWDSCCATTPERLSYGSWPELGDEQHVTFFSFRKQQPDEARVIPDSLRYAVGLFRNPKQYSRKDYGIGPDAYDNWARAAREHGASHGNWWNGMVWSECRKMAAAWFAEIAGQRSDIAGPAGELSAAYAEIGGLLERIASKELDATEKVRIVGELKLREEDAVGRIERLPDGLSRQERVGTTS
ncbi:MAG: hypothetical protein NTX53_05675 [candidate division WOR-3 bacterium]|nr:hypothetical protein [candidate division WOR-3 bacterium]